MSKCLLIRRCREPTPSYRDKEKNCSRFFDYICSGKLSRHKDVRCKCRDADS